MLSVTKNMSLFAFIIFILSKNTTVIYRRSILVGVGNQVEREVVKFCLVLWEGELDVYARLELNLRDVENLALAADELDDALVDSHLVSVPGLATFTARRLARSNSHASRRHRSRALDLDAGALFAASSVDSLGAADNLAAGLVDRLDVLRTDRDADVVLLNGLGHLAFLLLVRHDH